MPVRLIVNPDADRLQAYGPAQRAAVDPATIEKTLADLKSWPVYAPTPLVSLDGMARQVGISNLWVKDEGSRQPLQSFKALGGAYALGEVIRDEIERQTGRRPDYSELWAGKHSNIIEGLKVGAATDGNHGRSLAWAASVFGCDCTIYLPEIVTPSREAAIAQFGVRIERLPGNYDQVLTQVVQMAAESGRIIIQDTTHPGLDEGPTRRIMQGYMLLSQEIRSQLPDGVTPTHVFLQVGCGGLATAVAVDWWLNTPERPTIIIVEPVTADCMLQSLAASEPQVVDGSHETIMVGLACGEISTLAWPVLRIATDFAMAIDDAPAREIMRACAKGVDGDPAMIVGETGAAGLAALLAVSRSPELARQIGLGPDSRVLTINTEGALDSDRYREIVGEVRDEPVDLAMSA